MKKNLLFAAAVSLLAMTACTSDNNVASAEDEELEASGEVVISLNPSGVATRADQREPFSSEAESRVDQVTVCLFESAYENGPWAAPAQANTVLSEATVTDAAVVTLNDWDKNNSDPSLNKRLIKLKNLQKGKYYQVVAYGMNSDATGRSTIDGAAWVTTGTTVYNVANNTYNTPDELFAGVTTFQSNPTTGKVGSQTVVMWRQMAGVLGYFKNIPYEVDGKRVNSVRVTLRRKSTAITFPSSELQNQVPANESDAIYDVLTINVPASATPDANGIATWTGDSRADLAANGVKIQANSIIGGSFVLPVSAVTGNATITVSLCNAGLGVLKSWTAKTNNLGTNSIDFPINRNYLYSLGSKKFKNNGDPVDPDVPGDDDPLDLSVDNELNVTINNAWTQSVFFDLIEN